MSPSNISNKSDQSNSQNDYSTTVREKDKDKDKDNNPQKRGPRRGRNPLPEWNDNSDFQPDMPSSAMNKLSPRNVHDGKIIINF